MTDIAKQEFLRQNANHAFDIDTDENPAKVKAALFERGVLELVRDGRDLDYVAEKTGVPRALVAKALHKALARVKKDNKELAKAHVELELVRLDELTHHAMKEVAIGSKGSIQAALAIMERRAKLLGIDAAAKTDIKLTHEDSLARLEKGRPAS